MDTTANPALSAPLDTWLRGSDSSPSLVVERQSASDFYSALVDRAALAAYTALVDAGPGGRPEQCLPYVHAAIAAALFPTSEPEVTDSDFLEYIPMQVSHGPVLVEYADDSIRICADRVSRLATPAWQFCLDATALMNKPTFGSDISELKRYVLSVGLEELRGRAMTSANDLQRFLRDVLPHCGHEEKRALFRWGLRLHEEDPRSWVYFIRRGEDGPIKIGWSKSPTSRLAQLQTGHDMRLHLLATAPGGQWEESNLHRLFCASRLMGEWFAPTPALMGCIRNVRAGGSY